jgi:choline dehydrogenase-like flavoprotein
MSAMDRLQMILVLALDRALPDNRVTVGSDGLPVVHYGLGDSVQRALVQSMRACARIFFAAGAARVHAPAARTFFIERADQDRLDELIPLDGFKAGKVSVSSAHLMGGCRMGSGETESVTDAWGAIHGVPGLFVADASLFPASAEINPYITIMALADRVAERVRRDLPALRG